MSSCDKRCGGCRDFSSKAQRAPNIASIDVVEGILLKAAQNMRARHAAAARGEMTPEDLTEADDRLVDWLTATFSGRNPHFESAEEWNPFGLAALIREQSSSPELESMDDEAVVRVACGWFAADASNAAAANADDAALAELASRWAAGFAGMPDF